MFRDVTVLPVRSAVYSATSTFDASVNAWKNRAQPPIWVGFSTAPSKADRRYWVWAQVGREAGMDVDFAFWMLLLPDLHENIKNVSCPEGANETIDSSKARESQNIFQLEGAHKDYRVKSSGTFRWKQGQTHLFPWLLHLFLTQYLFYINIYPTTREAYKKIYFNQLINSKPKSNNVLHPPISLGGF